MKTATAPAEKKTKTTSPPSGEFPGSSPDTPSLGATLIHTEEKEEKDKDKNVSKG